MPIFRQATRIDGVVSRSAISLAVQRVLFRVKKEIHEDPELAQIPVKKLVLTICEELNINPAIAVFIAEEVKKRRDEENANEE